MAEPPFVISPELALIDPELARAARLLLAQPGTPWWRTGDAPVSVSPAAASLSIPCQETSPIAVEVARARSGAVRTIVLGSAAVLIAAIGVALAAELLRTPSSVPLTETPVRPGATRQAARPKSQATSRRLHRARSERGDALPPLAWVRVPGASHYRVELYRRGRKIFRGRTAEPRLQIPRLWRYRGRRFRLSPGRYRWLVYPSRGRGRYRAPMVNAVLVVPRA